MSVMVLVTDPRPADARVVRASDGWASRPGGYLGQFDSYRVVACIAVVLQHSLLWTLAAGNVAGWALVMLLHFSRTAFFFLSAFLLTYAELTRPRSTLAFWRRRYVQLGAPYLAWTVVYWIYTLIDRGGTAGHSLELLGRYTVFGYYQLYFCVVLFQLYLVFPFLLRLLRRSHHHGRIMTASLGLAHLLAADIHWPGYFGPIGHATVWIEQYWPWARNIVTYQEQIVASILIGLHFDQVRAFVERWYREVIRGAVAVGVVATLWYLGAVWTGSPTGGASDLYQPIAFVWFTSAVAALECGTWWWYRRTLTGHPPHSQVRSAEYLAGLTGGIFFSHVLVLDLVRTGLADLGISAHLGWAVNVMILCSLTLAISGVFVALVLRTPLRWVLAGPVRAEQRARLNGNLSDMGAASLELDPDRP
jgi:peptidoglycan/LPS O-acetylase OafA/YrhL